MSIETVAIRAVPEGRRQRLLAAVAGITTVVLWATAFVGVRDAGSEISPGALSLGRLVVGSLVLGAFVALRREPFPARADLPALVLLGVLWFGIYNVALSEAERRVDAGTAAMLVNTGPIIIAVLAGVVLKEGFPRTLVTGCAVAFAGVVIIGLATSENGVTAGWGTVLCLVAAVTYAVAVVAQKPLLLTKLGPLGHVAGVHDRRRGLPAVRPHARPRCGRLRHFGAGLDSSTSVRCPQPWPSPPGPTP